MSNKALTWAFEAAIANVGAKFVLVALADHASDHAGEDWTCFPSNERLMTFTGMPARTLERHISWLAAHGWISREAPRGAKGRLKVRHYRLHRDRVEPQDVVCPPAKLAGGETASPPAKNIATTRQKGGDFIPDLAGGYIAEPPEPPITPTPGARDLDAAFGELVAAWPKAGIDSTDLVEARTAFVAEVASEAVGGDPWRIVVAGTETAVAIGRQRRDFPPPSLNTWLRKKSYIGRLPPLRPQGLGEGDEDLLGIASPWPELRADLLAAKGEGFVASYFDQCVPEAGDRRRLSPRNGVAASVLAKDAREYLRRHGVVVGSIQIRQGAKR